jgi:hypothetical protein
VAIDRIEEVACSQGAQWLGWRVEYEASVHVIDGDPLQNRVISPKMRVISRHSKLLHFLKHLPRWQFLGLSRIVSDEAMVQLLVSKLKGRKEDVGAWRMIADVSRRLREGAELRGRDVLRLVNSVALPEHPIGDKPHVSAEAGASASEASTSLAVRAWTPRGARLMGATLLDPRKDGTA